MKKKYIYIYIHNNLLSPSCLSPYDELIKINKMNK